MLLQRLSENVAACLALGFMAGLLLVLGMAGPLTFAGNTAAMIGASS